MTTNTQRTKTTVQAPKAAPFDRVNSQTALTIYHRDHWQVAGRTTNCAKYYLKKTHDPAYEKSTESQQILIEMERATEAVKSKLNGENRRNLMKSIGMYVNSNKGGSLKDVDNTFLCRLDVKSNGRFTRTVNSEVIQNDPEWGEVFKRMLDEWEYEISRCSIYNAQ